MQIHDYTLVSVAGHWLFLWFGFYLLSRKPRSTATVLTAASMISVAVYMVGIAMADASHTRAEAATWGKMFGMLPVLAPMLWLHATLALTETRIPRQRLWLAVGYSAAAVVVALGLSSTLMYDYFGQSPDPAKSATAYPLGPLYPVFVAFLLLCLCLACIVLALARHRPPRSVVRQLDWLLAGSGLFALGTALLFVNAYSGWPVQEAYLQPILIAGALMIAYPVAHFPGLVEGQLLRKDLKASLFGATVLMTAFAILVVAANASHYVLAAAGWFVLAASVFNGQVRAMADRPFFGLEARGDRADLLSAARLAGGPAVLDTSALSPGQSGGLLDYAGEVERVGKAWERLRSERDLWTELLGQDDFTDVRHALALPGSWTPEQPFPAQDVKESVEARLEPRERMAIGLKYLGYSDREMAQVMGVKPNVPRSYLAAAKYKLELPAGAPLTLFAHFSGVVAADALPLLGVMPAAGRPGAAQSAASEAEPSSRPSTEMATEHTDWPN